VPAMDVQPEQRLFVGNLPQFYKEAELTHLFAPFGKILECRIASDKETGRSKGFGFVTLGTRTGALEAIKNLNGIIFPDGRACTVEVSDSKPATGSAGGHRRGAPNPYQAHHQQHQQMHNPYHQNQQLQMQQQHLQSRYQEYNRPAAMQQQQHNLHTSSLLVKRKRTDFLHDPFAERRDSSRDR
jgi:cold-inducible RNA-binding protein